MRAPVNKKKANLRGRRLISCRFIPDGTFKPRRYDAIYDLM